MFLTYSRFKFNFSFQELERQAKTHGLPISDFSWPTMPTTNIPLYNPYGKSQSQPITTNLMPSLLMPDPTKKVIIFFILNDFNLPKLIR